MRPDVTLLAPYPPAGQRHGGHSGVASYTANLAGALADEGARVVVVAPRLGGDEPDEFDDRGVRVMRRYPLGARSIPAAARAVAELGAGVTHLQWELFLYGGPRSIPGLVPSLGHLRRRGALVTTMHQVLDPRSIDRATVDLHRIGAPAPIARAGLSTVQRAIAAASDVTVVHERAFADIVAGRATTIPHGIERPHTVDRCGARQRLGLDDRFVAMCFGFLAPYKGLELVADAAALVGDRVEVVFAGGTHPRLDAGYERLLADRSAGRARLTGWVADGDVADWFAAADVALFPYPKPFSASGALALALAHDTPILLSPPLARCIGAPNTVTVPMRPDALAVELDRLARHPHRLDNHAAWTTALRHGREWPDVARRHLEVYEEVRHGTAAPAGRLRAA